MALTASKVRVAVSGEVYVAPTGTALPTDTTAALNAAFKAMGYVSEDGITQENERDIEDILAWQNAAVVRSRVTSAKESFTFTLIETSKDTVEFAYGTTVTQSAPHGTYTITPSATGGSKAFVFEIIDGTNIKRIAIAEGEISERGETVYASGEPIGYEVTVVAYTSPSVIDSALKT
jgi:hypothetical protein